MFAFTSSGISLADAVAVLQLVNGVRQLLTLVRGQGSAGLASVPADALAQRTEAALHLA